MITQSTTREL